MMVGQSNISIVTFLCISISYVYTKDVELSFTLKIVQGFVLKYIYDIVLLLP